jgi:putative ABC transport system ATP-binding protein
MFCDEPTGALDSRTGVVVIEALVSANREIGTTTAIITHNAAIGAVADTVFHFLDGRIDKVEKNTKRADPSEIRW